MPSDVQARSSGIPWAEMRGMRHRIIHEYLRVDIAIVWQTITEDLPPLTPSLQALRHRVKVVLQPPGVLAPASAGGASGTLQHSLPEACHGHSYDARRDRQAIPALVSHLICESLGYFTPEGAAGAILAVVQNRHAPANGTSTWRCGRRSLEDVGRDTVRRAIRSRHHHRGFMAEYKHARALVDRLVRTGESPTFASWF